MSFSNPRLRFGLPQSNLDPWIPENLAWTEQQIPLVLLTAGGLMLRAGGKV